MKIKFYKIILGLLISTSVLVGCTSAKKEPIKLDVEHVLDLSVLKTRKTVAGLSSAVDFPRSIEKGNKNWDFVGVKDWCSGFWPGVLWYAYEFSGDESIKKQAERFTAPIKEIAYTSAENHDIGFMVYCSFGNGYRLTGNEEYKKVLLSAADTLATLYNPNVGSLLSWPIYKDKYMHNTIIDNMMNLELLFWASKNGGSKKLYEIAESHAEVTMNNIVRKDSAVYHLASFNDKTGEFIKGYTHQGYANESMWARGQTWGIYGFAMAYRETGRKDFLNTSIKLTEHYLDRLPKDGIPFWDFDDPRIPNAPKDASAAAVAACGMLELSCLVQDKELKQKYFKEAKRFLAKLSSEEYYSGETNQALLLHSTGHHPKNSEIDTPIIYADYYYMEAMLKLRQIENKQDLGLLKK
ncbi:glycoside hydrolase family 88 protein [Polaribacter undariae]|uniref:Glycoside hydrolase family 88 protein n=1 Tax=Polaribacter sejongensis TaxID=985043 RepID=A0AAJ1QYQ8_9FLAO|nr:glycoside hydrolase family 88 protein [Polaribacter undariae]MDN3620071.1 glycoside hydrolase family 88 protein [Polaribacter undariae]UWD32218.1 glycoside hydrolase family 88 protein [Polaribacter undariae]